MDIVLLVITLISAATAVVAVASARRLRSHERVRSEARVAALASAAEAHGASDGGWTQVAGEWQWTPETAIPVTERIPTPGSRSSDFEPQVSSGAFFGTVQREDTSGSWLPLFAAAALIVTLGGALFFLNHSSNDSTGYCGAGESR